MQIKFGKNYPMMTIWMNIKILFTQSRIKFGRFFLKIERFCEFLILQSRWLNLYIIEGKNEFLK